SVTRYIEEKLGLVVNMTKSKVTKPNNPDMKFLGFGFFRDYQNRLYKAKPHRKSVESFKYKLKQLTRRKRSVDTKYQVERIKKLKIKIRNSEYSDSSETTKTVCIKQSHIGSR